MRRALRVVGLVVGVLVGAAALSLFWFLSYGFPAIWLFPSTWSTLGEMPTSLAVAVVAAGAYLALGPTAIALCSSKYRALYKQAWPLLRATAWMVFLLDAVTAVATIVWARLTTPTLYQSPDLWRLSAIVPLACAASVLLVMPGWAVMTYAAGVYSTRLYNKARPVFFTVCLLAFVACAYGATHTPVVWTPLSLGVRIGALVFGLVTLLQVLAWFTPIVLRSWERRSFPNFVASRHVRSKDTGLVSVVSALSIASVFVSSCSLCGVTSVMGGFGADLKRKMLDHDGHVFVGQESRAPWVLDEALVDTLRKAPGVVGVSPVLSADVMASTRSTLAGVQVRGIDVATFSDVSRVPEVVDRGKFEWLAHPEDIEVPSPSDLLRQMGIEPARVGAMASAEELSPETRAAMRPKDKHPGVAIGRELAKTLHVMQGDVVSFVSPDGDLGPTGLLPRTRHFRVAAIFYTGMYEFDATNVFITLNEARSFLGVEAQGVSSLVLRVSNPEHVRDETRGIEDALKGNPKLMVTDWQQLHKGLFSALQLEKVVTYVVFAVAVVVASFCIVCTLLLMVSEKARDVAILKAMGASDKQIMRVFTLEGFLIGVLGTSFGVASGVSLCLGLAWFGVRIPPDVYYVDHLPVSVNPGDYLVIFVVSVAICTLCTLYPAYAAAKPRPVEGLRSSHG